MKLIIFISFFYLVSCAGSPPALEYSFAKTALKAARKVNSITNAESQWIKAKEYYHRGEKAFSVRDFISAKKWFSESIRWAEKAENISRFKMSTGEGV